MRWQAIPLLTVAVLLGSVHGGDQDKELARLEGKYILVSGEADGKKLPDEDIDKSRLVLQGNKHRVRVGETKIIGTHSVDPTGRPKTIDAMDTEGPYKDKTVLGIYKIEGDTFSVCFAPPGKERPTEFTTTKGTGVIYHVWKRKKD